MIKTNQLLLIIILTLAITLASLNAVHASTWYVNCDTGINTTEGGYGTSGSFPWKTITYASTQAGSGDIINVAAGRYNTATGESFPISVPANVLVKASVEAGVTVATFESTNARVFTLNLNSTVEGFTIKTSGQSGSDGAVYLVGPGYVLNNTINCSASSARAVYVPDGADGTIISGNTIEVAASAYGIVAGASSTMTDNLIKGAGSGYGLSLSGWAKAFTVSSNEVRSFQYGIWFSGSVGASVSIYNNTILNNTSSGIYFTVSSGSPTVNVKNNIICGNTQLASFTTGTTGISGSGTLTSTYNNIWNVADAYYGAVSNKTGDITKYPRFITAEGIYKIGTDSPCATGGQEGTHMGRYAPSGTSGITAESWVDDDGSDSNSGTLASPWKTIGKGLSLTDGTVHLKAGTYNAANGDVFPYTLAEDQVVNSVASPTSLATVDAAAATPRVFGLGPYATVEGCTIKTNAANASNGAVYLLDTGFVLNNTIICSASGAIGVFVPGSAANGTIISGNTVEVAASGYGIVDDADCKITNNLLKGNGSGWGIYLYPSYNSIEISTNEVRGFQYGICNALSGDTVNIYNNTILNNTAAGIYYTVVSGSPTVNVKNNIICGNTQLASFTTGTIGIHRDNSSGTLTSTYNDIWNVADVYSGSAVSNTTGDITKYPRFITAEGVYKIGTDSPCAAGGEGGTYMGRYAPAGNSGITSESWVDDDGSDGNSGTLASPWKTIGKGLSRTDGTVHLKAGTYNAANGDTFSYTLAEDQIINSVASPTTSATVDAGSTARVFGLGPYATIEGITVKTAGVFADDGAIYVFDTAYVLSNTITCGASSAIGVYVDSAAAGARISGNAIEVNASGYGIQSGADCNITNNLLRGSGSGRGIYLYSSNKNGEVCTNEVRGFQYGIFTGLSGTVTGNVYKNTIAKNQYGIATWGTSGTPTFNLTNNIIASEVGGYSVSGSKGIWQQANGTVNSTYNDIYATDATYEGTVSLKTQDLQKDPKLVDAANNDFHLAYNSPCIDAGDPASTPDPDGSRADMGCYPYNQTTSSTPCVYVKTPNGGENLTGLATYEITWYATHDGTPIDHIELFYSTNGGGSYSTITNNTANDGSYIWTVPNIATVQGVIKTVAVGSAGTDESDANFTVSTVEVNNYYVGPSGNNGNDGFSWDTAWRNISYAATQAAYGKTINVAAGTYNAAAGENLPIGIPAGVRLVSQASPTNSATIDAGTGIRAVVLNSGSTLEGFTVKTGGGNGIDKAVYLAAMAYVKNNIIKCTAQNAFAVYLADAADNSQVQGNIITTVDNGRGIMFYDSCTGVLIKSNTIEVGVNSRALYLGYYCHNVTIDQNDITSGVNSDAVFMIDYTSGYALRNNIIKGPGTGNANGIYFYNCYSGVVCSNEVRGFRVAFTAQIGGASICDVYNNTIVDIYGAGANPGYGIYRSGSGTVNLKNNIVCAYPALGKFEYGGYGTYGIYRSVGTVNSSYNCSWNNNFDFYNVTPGVGDITYCPRFIGPYSNDFRIGADSPCAASGEGGTYMGAYPPLGISSGCTAESWVDANSGNDSYDGSFANPWQTLTKAATLTVNTIHVNDGTYNLGSSYVTLAEDVYMRSEAIPSTSATIESSSARVVGMGETTTLEGFTIKSSGDYYNLGAVTALDTAYIFSNIINCSVSGAQGIYLRDHADNSVIKWNNISAAGSGYGIELNRDDFDTGVTGVLVESNSINVGSSGQGIRLDYYCNDFIFDSNTIFVGSGSTGIYTGGYTSGFVIRKNKMRGVGNGSGIASYLLHGGAICSNEVDNFQSGIDLQCDTNYTHEVFNNTIVNNSLYGIYKSSSGTANIWNNIICGKPSLSSFTSGNIGIYQQTAPINSSYNDVWNHGTNFYGVVPGSGDISVCPRFFTPEANSYYFGTDSPCATSGKNGAYMGAYPPLASSSNKIDDSWVNALSGSNGSSGTSDATAWKSITYAATRTVGTIHAAAGKYDSANGETFPITLGELQRLRSEASPSILAVIETNNPRVVGTGPNATLEGFTIKTSGSLGSDGAVYLMDTSFILSNTVTCSASNAQGLYLRDEADGSQIKSNNIWVMGSGNAIQLYDSCTNILVQYNTIEAGVSGYGIRPGYYCDNNIFDGNTITVSSNGYGIYAGGLTSNYNIRNNLIKGVGSGYGIDSYMIRNGSMSMNEIRGFQYGISSYLENAGRTNTVDKNTIVNNSNGIYSLSGTTIAKNNIIAYGTKGLDQQSGTVTSTYNCLYGNPITYEGGSGGTGDIEKDPRFIDAGIKNYHLQISSPCIDTGDPASPIDPDGTRIDMGRYSYFQTDFTGPTIEVVTPTLGEGVIALTPYNITWTMTDESGIRSNSLSLYYSTNEGSSYSTIATGEPNDGTYQWPVPWIATSKAKIRITAYDGAPFNQTGNLGTGESGLFSILTDIMPPTVEVISPNGNEKWKGNSPHNITFTATDEYGIKANSASFYYTSGEVWAPIATGQATNAAYPWTLPLISSTEVRVRATVLDNNNNIGTDESNGVFTIDSIAPTVSVIVPNTGTTWEGNRSQNITWTASDNFTLEVNPITIYCSINNGASYDLAASNEANDGTFSWNIPAIDTTEAKVKVSAIDESSNIATQESGKFIIDSTPPTTPNLSYPQNGVTISTASPNLTWEASADTISGVASYEITIDTTVTTQGATASYIPTPPLSEMAHTWKVRARNGAGMWSNYSTTFNFTVDLLSPEVTGITLKDRITGSTQYTNQLTVTVDAAGVAGGPSQMRLAQNSGFSQNDTGWISYQNPTQYTFTAGEGTREVYYKLRDTGLNESPVRTNNIIVDTITPEVSYIVLKDRTDGSTLESNELTISVEAYGVSQDAVVMNIAQNGGFSQNATGWISYRQSSEYTFTGSNGTREAYLKVRDAAQNESNVAMDNIMVKASRPTVTISAPNGGERMSGLGQTYTIRYTAADAYGLKVNPITIRLSTNSGVTWTPIAAGEANTGTYNWTVPAIDSTLCRISVEAENTVGVVGSDMSDSDFIIDSTRPTIVSITPSNGATSVALSAEVTIEFSEEMSRESVLNAFSMGQIAVTFTWNSNGRIVTFKPSASLNYSTIYNPVISTTAADLTGNGMASAFTSSFITVGRGDSEAPKVVIKIVDNDGKEITLKDGDYVNGKPKFRGVITDNLGIARSTIKCYLDGTLLTPSITETSPMSMTAEFSPLANLTDEKTMTHTVKVEAEDTASNAGIKEIKGLKVSYEPAKLVGQVITYPRAFSPKTGTTAKIVYNLTADSDVKLFMFDPSGQNVWTNRPLSGSEGGRAGYNEVSFKGISDIGGTLLGNGIYVVKLVANNKVVGTGYITIYD